MLTVIVSARKKDTGFWTAFHSLIENNFSAIHAYERKLVTDRTEAKLIVTDTECFDTIQSDKTIIIFRDTVGIDIDSVETHHAIAVMDACNERLIPVVASTKLPTITCGLSARDTLTLSSICTDSAVIDLQRSITCFDGSVAEPQEIPVRLGNITDSFALMAAASICILSGEIKRLHSFRI